MIPAMEATFASAVKSGKIPGAVIMAKNSSGTFLGYLFQKKKIHSRHLQVLLLNSNS